MIGRRFCQRGCPGQVQGNDLCRDGKVMYNLRKGRKTMLHYPVKPLNNALGALREP